MFLVVLVYDVWIVVKKLSVLVGLASPHISVHDETAFISLLTAELQPLVPDQQVVVVVDHNYSE